MQQATLLALQASILLTVFGFGLHATRADVLHVLARPSLLVRSLLAMFVVMPLVALLLVRMFDLRPSVEIALVALSISPLPPLLPGREAKAGGRASFGLGLMAIVGLLAIAIVPLGIALVGRVFGQSFAMAPGTIATLVFKTVILPLAVGMLVRALAPGLAGAIAKPVAITAKVLLVAGALAVLVAVAPVVLTLVGNGTLAAMAAFVAIGVGAGHWMGGPRHADRIALALSTASRHPVIALTIARANFPDQPLLGATIILYLLVALLAGAPYIAMQKRRTASFD